MRARFNLGANLLTPCRVFHRSSYKNRISTVHQHLQDQTPRRSFDNANQSVKKFFRPFYGHTPQELPAADVSAAATSCFIAYQALTLYYTFPKIAIVLQIYIHRNSMIFQSYFCTSCTTPKSTKAEGNLPNRRSPAKFANCLHILYIYLSTLSCPLA